MAKPNRPAAPRPPSVVFRTCELYDKTLAIRAREQGIGQKLIDFKNTKLENKMQPFGKTDRAFSNEGNFAGLRHAHITPDVSIVYRLHSNNPSYIDLYGLFTHDELGTGQPPHLRTQSSMGKKLAGQQFK